METTPSSPDISGVVGVLGATAEEVKAGLAPARAEAQRQLIAAEKQLEADRAELEARRMAMEAEFRRRKSELEAQMAPLKKQISQLTEVAWTVDLYLGRDETVELLTDGAPAPADTPLTIRQNVLAADEESLILLDYKGVDANSMGNFLDWIAASPDNRDRILPEQRCVVAVVPSRQNRDYGDRRHNAAMEAANRQTYWLLRNGERLYVMTTDFVAGDRILPRNDEFVTFFNTRRFGAPDGPMLPGSDEWLAAEESADARRRHFMRAMLILQGIVDRSVVFHPLPEGGLNLMSLTSQDHGKLRIINETDGVLTDGRESYFQWRKRLNAQLRPGLRVVLARPSGGFTIHPKFASQPPLQTPLVVTGRHPEGGFRIAYDRTDEVWEKYEEPVPGKPGWVYKRERLRTAKGKASIRITADDDHVLPFDLAETADLEYYLNSRDARTSYLSMAPVLRAVLEARRAEEEAEAPFRAALTSTIMAEHGLVEDRAREVTEQACTIFKTGSAWGRALSTDESAAAAGVLKEAAAIIAAKDSTANANKAVAAAREAFGGNLLAVTMNRQGVFHAYAPANDPDTIHHGTAGYLTELSLGTRGVPGKRREWVRLAPRSLSTRTIVHAADGWVEFQHADPSIHLTGPEAQAIINSLLAKSRAAGHRPAVAVLKSASTYGEYVERDIILFSVDPDAGAEPDNLPALVATWSRGADGKVSTQTGRGRWNERWGHYSNGAAPTVPWDESKTWADQRRPYRVWSDESVVEEIFAACKAAEQAGAQQRAANNHVYRLRETMRRQAVAAWEKQQLEVEYQRFVEDFATEDAALWDHHQRTLRLKPLPAVFAKALAAAPVEGAVTFASLPGDELAAALAEYPFMADTVMGPEPEPAADGQV